MVRMEWFVHNYLPSQSDCASMQPTLSILDVGSYNVNGTYKRFFNGVNFTYTGLDIAAGPNVDIVAENPYNWDMLPDESYDVVISGQAFEHIEFFWITMTEIARVLKRGGLVCIIVPRGFGLHRYPIDAYRFDADGIIALARYVNLEPLHASCNLAPPDAPRIWYSDTCSDSMLIARKPSNWTGIIDNKTYKYTDADMERLATGFVKDTLKG